MAYLRFAAKKGRLLLKGIMNIGKQTI